VASSGLLQSFTVLDDDTSLDERVHVDGARRRSVAAVIGDEWGIVFAQGGVVMATMLHAAELVVARGDLRMTTASATFCRPVPCGPVTIDVEVLRNGRAGVQVHATLRCGRDTDPSPNAVATVVFVAEAAGWPELHGLACPHEFGEPPGSTSPRLGIDNDTGDVTDFFRQTDWREAATQPADPMRRLVWFSFTETPRRADGTWPSPVLAVPGDALGLAVVPHVSDIMGPLIAPSLQMSIQCFAPARGRWLAIDSRCLHVQASTAAGIATLWNVDGSLVGAITQTAMLRPR
jgi:acyl-CoA thioesterase